MDAKIGHWVVTPRTGKPVEINALWINALESMSQFAVTLKIPSTRFEALGAAAKASFQKFWNPDRDCLYDVIDSPGIGNDPSVRPNQILAVSLPVSPLTQEQQESVVNACERELLTPFGLRSLSPHDASYIAHYGGGPRERDAAYHQGTVWGWLLGPFALAHSVSMKTNRRPAASLNRKLKPSPSTVSAPSLKSTTPTPRTSPPAASRKPGPLQNSSALGNFFLDWL